jgi:hypothetical protein
MRRAMDIALGEVFTGVFTVRVPSIHPSTPEAHFTTVDVRYTLGTATRRGRNGV